MVLCLAQVLPLESQFLQLQLMVFLSDFWHLLLNFFFSLPLSMTLSVRGSVSTKETLIYVLIDLSLITGRYFDEISQDTGKYCFGVEDTLKALEMGAVEILIVYENLDIMRYVLHCQGTEGMRIRK